MTRILTALILAPAIVAVVLWGPPLLLAAVVAIVSVLCYREYSTIAGGYGFGAPGPLGYGAGLLVLLAPAGVEWILLALLLVALTLFMRAAELRDALPRAALLAAGVLYVFGCFRCAFRLHDWRPHWLMFGLLLSWIGDTGAYYVGRRWGRHKLARRISPGKSWEGAAASLAVSVAVGLVYGAFFLADVPWYWIAPIAAAVNAAGQVGDLAESAMKRGAGIKDSGSILPGHGGFLDRVDSTLFALPVLYLLLAMTGYGIR